MPPHEDDLPKDDEDLTNEEDFLRRMPKVELHLHLEGTMEPELLMKLAKQNKIKLRFKTVEEIRQAYDFQDLQSFLDLYYEGMSVLIEEQDFFDLAMEYLKKMKEETTRHVEVFFDPQPHLQRGVAFETVVNGFHRALQTAADEFDISFHLIMCFVRHLPVEDAFRTLELSKKHKDKIYAVGLDSTEKGYHPSLYKELFAACREAGYRCVAHAGEEGPPEYVFSALDDLKVERIDHGVRCMEDPSLVARLVEEQIALTVCPLSNVKLCVIKCMGDHCIRKMLHAGICVTVNSDDPAYFGGYLTSNYLALSQDVGVTRPEHIQLAKTSSSRK
jgi:adenosine deaminase